MGRQLRSTTLLHHRKSLIPSLDSPSFLLYILIKPPPYPVISLYQMKAAVSIFSIFLRQNSSRCLFLNFLYFPKNRTADRAMALVQSLIQLSSTKNFGLWAGA